MHIFFFVFLLTSVHLNEFAAKKNRDGLAKAIYACVMQHIISTINGNAENNSPYIGILDIAGFGE